MKRKIGVIDSGVGALTVAKKIQEILPNEGIIYFGDNGNVPYGNRSEEEIYELTKRMIDFLVRKDVKVIAVACNTISTLVDKYFSDYEVPIISIIDPVSKYVADLGLDEVGVIATNFTINSGEYDKKIGMYSDKDIKIIKEASPELASLVDSGVFTEEQVVAIVSKHLENVKNNGDNVENVILGCTHYPIVEHLFRGVAPDITFINPALEQVKEVKRVLSKNQLLNTNGKMDFELYTTGNKKTYDAMIDLLEMDKPNKIIELDIDYK